MRTTRISLRLMAAAKYLGFQGFRAAPGAHHAHLGVREVRAHEGDADPLLLRQARQQQHLRRLELALPLALKLGHWPSPWRRARRVTGNRRPAESARRGPGSALASPHTMVSLLPSMPGTWREARDPALPWNHLPIPWSASCIPPSGALTQRRARLQLQHGLPGVQHGVLAAQRAHDLLARVHGGAEPIVCAAAAWQTASSGTRAVARTTP